MAAKIIEILTISQYLKIPGTPGTIARLSPMKAGIFTCPGVYQQVPIFKNNLNHLHHS
jgi:hypothetical protein